LIISAKKTFATIPALSGGLQCDGAAFGAKQTLRRCYGWIASGTHTCEALALLRQMNVE